MDLIGRVDRKKSGKAALFFIQHAQRRTLERNFNQMKKNYAGPMSNVMEMTATLWNFYTLGDRNYEIDLNGSVI